MAIKKFVAISYCFAFLFVYFAQLGYAMISESINRNYNTALPQTTAMNSTITAVSSISSAGSFILIIGVVALVVAIFFIIISTRAMGCGIN